MMEIMLLFALYRWAYWMRFAERETEIIAVKKVGDFM
jgi:hypothetical protein